MKELKLFNEFMPPSSLFFFGCEIVEIDDEISTRQSSHSKTCQFNRKLTQLGLKKKESWRKSELRYQFRLNSAQKK